ncbi:MAG: response regulator [Pseudanabaenaceae cyanobacterium SKYGB_i_bin29]|nr:response regulator [Pseudanabaenaceae cyanobacterium SKYG29]MDW8422065.1 response regulator [Pseudanabaenaceae cyanobacterium SKYGB_i_bin29]
MTKVMVVDDSSTIREVMAEQLRSGGFEVVEASDGVEAVNKIKALKDDVPQVIVTDVVMPNMNGYEFCRWVKNNPATKNVPVIMCSTKGEAFDEHWARKNGAAAYIRKPFEPVHLLNTVNELLAATKS